MSRAAQAVPGFSRGTRLGLVGLTVVGFLLALWLQLPAALLLRFLPSPLPAPWATSPGGLAAAGTVWEGELRGLIAGGIPIRSVHWQLSPWRVLVGQLHGSAVVLGDGAKLAGRFSLRFDGTGELTALNGELPLALLQPASPQPWNGQVLASLKSLTLVAGKPERFSGRVDVLRLSSPAVTQALGDFRLEWPSASDQGRISTLGGPVDLRAALLRQPGGGFRLDGEARANASAAPVVQQALMTFGLPDAAGRYRIQVELGVSARP